MTPFNFSNNFSDNARVAVTLSFDDGTIHDRRLVSVLNDLGLRATWNLNSGALDDGDNLRKNEIVELFQGHEIAAHSVTHPHFDRISDNEIRREYLDDRGALEAITQAPVRGFAYPFGNYSPRVLRVLDALPADRKPAYARTCENTRDIFGCETRLAWPTSSFQLATDESGQTVWPDEFLHRYESGESFCYHVWGHSREFDGQWENAQKWFGALSGLPDVYYCTNLELCDAVSS